MADYAASVLAKAQVMLNDRFQAAEMRAKPSSVLMTLLKNTNFLIPDVRQLRTREDRITKAYLKNRASRALGAGRSATHSGAVADSSEVPVDFVTYPDTFSTSLKRGDNNVFTDAEILAHEIENSLINLHEGIETALVTWLDANKNTVSAPPSGAIQRAPFNVVNDVYEVALANENEYWNIIKSIFRQEKYSEGTFDVITDSLLASTGDFKANQGTGNSTNLGFQFAGLSVMESIEVSDASYTSGLSFAMPTGMTGIIDWTPIQNRQGKGNFDSYLGGFSTLTDPMTGLDFAIHGFTERADTSGANGNAQDEVTQWEMSIDLSPQHAPISTAGQTPIFAVGQLAV